jgi:hypothetical protein
MTVNILIDDQVADLDEVFAAMRALEMAGKGKEQIDDKDNDADHVYGATDEQL